MQQVAGGFSIFSTGLLVILLSVANADQQADKDDGSALGTNLLNDVQNIGTSSDPAGLVPGYQGSNLPESQYYNNQDLSGMQEDAIVDINSGAASDAAQFAYEQSSIPTLQFNANDPILQNAASIGGEAVLNPEVLSVQTGDCAVVDVDSVEKRIEHCTAWKLPTSHTCNKTLDVQVAWEDVSNCPLGISFSQVQSPSGFGGADAVYARAYCNPGSGDNEVDLQVHALGGKGACTNWRDIRVSTDLPVSLYTGKAVSPHWGGNCRAVPTFVQGGCVDGDCNYNLDFVLLSTWSKHKEDKGGPFIYTCHGTARDLISQGLTDYLGGGWQKEGTGNHCVLQSTTLSLSFEKPTLVRTPSVTESWNDGCGFLQAQVP